MHYTHEITHGFDTGPQARLDVSVVKGTIAVRGEDRQDVALRITASFEADSDEAAEAVLRKIESGIEQRGNHVRIETTRGHHGRHGFFRDDTRLRLDVDIAAPRDCSARLRAVHGDIEARELSDDTVVDLVNGSVDLADLGSLGSIHLVNGRISLRRIAGSVDARLTHGEITIAETGTTTFRLINGRVSITDPADEVQGHCVSGKVEVTGRLAADVSLHNAMGSTVLNVPEDSRFELDAQSQFGEVESELSLSEGPGRGERLPRVRLRSEMGRIQLRALRAAEATPA